MAATKLQGLRVFYGFRGVEESKDGHWALSENGQSCLVPTLYHLARKQQSLVGTVEQSICLFDGLANWLSRPRSVSTHHRLAFAKIRPTNALQDRQRWKVRLKDTQWG
jgi:hypothetical protein